MKKPNFKRIFNSIETVFHEHSPEILTGLGITGMLTTTILAVKATPKAILILNEEECRRAKVAGPPFTISKRDVILLTWKCYVPSTIICGASIGCLLGASSVSSKRNAALATAYSISESVLKDYQEKVIETIGEKKEQFIRDEIAKDEIQRNPVNEQTIIITNKGDTLCYDVISGRYFKTDIDKIKRIENELNCNMIREGYISLNDFYYEIGLESISVGNELGWNLDNGQIDLYFTSQLTPDNTPCLVINYRIEPKNNYSKCM